VTAASDRLAVYTTVYPAAERFLPAWYDSVRQQTDQDFDVWVGLDGLTAERVTARLDSPGVIHWVEAAAGASPAGIRNTALRQLVASYPGVVLVDSDDLLAPERVAAARAALASDDLNACGLRLMDEDGCPSNRMFGVARDTDLDALLPSYNVFGLSNTAYRSEILGRCLPVPDDCVLIDWLLATRAWWQDARLTIDPAPRMWYRQYRDNTARVVGPFTPEEVLRATGLVLEHYRMALSEARGSTPKVRRVAAARTRTERFARAVTESRPLLLEYVERLNDLTPASVWWWCVGHPELESLWRA
jgi:hypothetical protein